MFDLFEIVLDRTALVICSVSTKPGSYEMIVKSNNVEVRVDLTYIAFNLNTEFFILTRSQDILSWHFLLRTALMEQFMECLKMKGFFQEHECAK